jgi:hypothetical protein
MIINQNVANSSLSKNQGYALLLDKQDSFLVNWLQDEPN